MKRTPRRRTFPSGRPHGFPRAQKSWRGPAPLPSRTSASLDGGTGPRHQLGRKDPSTFFQSTSLPVLMFDDDRLRKRAEQQRVSAGDHYPRPLRMTARALITRANQPAGTGGKQGLSEGPENGVECQEMLSPTWLHLPRFVSLSARCSSCARTPSAGHRRGRTAAPVLLDRLVTARTLAIWHHHLDTDEVLYKSPQQCGFSADQDR